jgi:hypothetical protein
MPKIPQRVDTSLSWFSMSRRRSFRAAAGSAVPLRVARLGRDTPTRDFQAPRSVHRLGAVQIHTSEDVLSIELSPAEKLLCFKWRPIALSRSHLQRVTAGVPETSWTDLRIPGTAVPGLIRAGTYRTRRGKEFWNVHYKRHTSVVVLELEGHRYRRLVLGSSDGDLVAFFKSWGGLS